MSRSTCYEGKKFNIHNDFGIAWQIGMSSFWHLNLFLVLASPFVGSFLGLIVNRRPHSGKFVFDRSRCCSCERTLAFADLIPIASYVASKGRCRYCGVKIGFTYPAMEMATLTIAITSVALSQPSMSWLSILLGWWLLALSAIDFREYLLPDSMTYPLIAIGLTLSLIRDPQSMPDHLIGAVVGYLIFYGIAWAYRRLRGRDGLGMGDAKLFAAAGAWLTWEGLSPVLMVASLGGLAYALLMRSPQKLGATQAIAFGPFLALGFWIVWLLTSPGTTL